MEVEITLQDYLDKIKTTYDLPHDLSYKEVVNQLRQEVEIRESLVSIIPEKIERLRKFVDLNIRYFGRWNTQYDKYINDLKISDIDTFKIEIKIIEPIDEQIMSELLSIKLQLQFKVWIWKETLHIEPNFEKLKKLKRYL